MSGAATPGRCLHVGLPKAGSSTLQQNLFRHLEGIDYHALRRKGGGHDEVDGDFHRLVRACREGHALDLDVPALRRALAFEPADGRPVVVSEERFATHYGLSMRAKPALLREVLGPARILLVVRHPAALLRSSYYQELRHPRYARATAATFARWLEEAFEHRHHALSPYALVRYDWTIDAFAAAFGRDAVHVVPLEWMRAAPARFARAVGTAIGVDADTVAATLAAHDEPRNVRPDGAMGGLRGLGRGSLRRPSDALRSTLAARRANVGGARERDALARILEDLAGPLGRLADEHGVPVRDLGYGAPAGASGGTSPDTSGGGG